MFEITPRIIYRQLQSLSDQTIKKHIERKRLKFSRKDISLLLYLVYFATRTGSELKFVHDLFYQKGKITMKYSAFMSDISTLSPLFFVLFRKQTKKVLKKNKQFHYVITDTSVLTEKENHCLKKKDKSRIQKRQKRLYCGKKIQAITTKNNLILGVSLEKINTFDGKLFPDIIGFILQEKILVKNILADKAYGSEENREFSQEYNTFLCSPYRENQIKDLPQNKKNLYKNRSKIENIFKEIKNSKGKYRLSFKGVRNKKRQEGLVYLTAWLWNRNMFVAVIFPCYIGFTSGIIPKKGDDYEQKTHPRRFSRRRVRAR